MSVLPMRGKAVVTLPSRFSSGGRLRCAGGYRHVGSARAFPHGGRPDVAGGGRPPSSSGCSSARHPVLVRAASRAPVPPLKRLGRLEVIPDEIPHQGGPGRAPVHPVAVPTPAEGLRDPLAMPFTSWARRRWISNSPTTSSVMTSARRRRSEVPRGRCPARSAPDAGSARWTAAGGSKGHAVRELGTLPVAHELPRTGMAQPGLPGAAGSALKLGTLSRPEPERGGDPVPQARSSRPGSVPREQPKRREHRLPFHRGARREACVVLHVPLQQCLEIGMLILQRMHQLVGQHLAELGRSQTHPAVERIGFRIVNPRSCAT